MHDPDYDPRDDEHKGSAGPALLGLALLFMILSVLWEARHGV
jgi:hypothetical protein